MYFLIPFIYYLILRYACRFIDFAAKSENYMLLNAINGNIVIFNL